MQNTMYWCLNVLGIRTYFHIMYMQYAAYVYYYIQMNDKCTFSRRWMGVTVICISIENVCIPVCWLLTTINKIVRSVWRLKTKKFLGIGWIVFHCCHPVITVQWSISTKVFDCFLLIAPSWDDSKIIWKEEEEALHFIRQRNLHDV